MTKFLHERQGEGDATIDDVKNVFSNLNSLEISGVTDRTGADGKGDDDSIDRVRFEEYLAGMSNDLFDPEKRKFDSSTLTRPCEFHCDTLLSYLYHHLITHQINSVPEYWINSSHNTYLTGDQLKSISSVEMYVVAMQR